jgi:predicted  nucleic acid-binding Zn ribbon protein
MNGQVCSGEWGIARRDDLYEATVLLPEPGSLDEQHGNRYVRGALDALAQAHLAMPEIEIVGQDVDGLEVCPCATPSCYILYTDYLTLEPPLRCGECFGPVPLYRVPPTYDGEYSDVIRWQSDYQACDRLQMGCRTLERAATRQMSDLRSSLSRQGIEVCETITATSAVPTYYYLYRHTGRSLRQERRRRCPSCGGEWLLGERWHGLFDFRCDRCRLLSNISWRFCPVGASGDACG